MFTGNATGHFPKERILRSVQESVVFRDYRSFQSPRLRLKPERKLYSARKEHVRRLKLNIPSLRPPKYPPRPCNTLYYQGKEKREELIPRTPTCFPRAAVPRGGMAAKTIQRRPGDNTGQDWRPSTMPSFPRKKEITSGRGTFNRGVPATNYDTRPNLPKNNYMDDFFSNTDDRLLQTQPEHPFREMSEESIPSQKHVDKNGDVATPPSTVEGLGDGEIMKHISSSSIGEHMEQDIAADVDVEYTETKEASSTIATVIVADESEEMLNKSLCTLQAVVISQDINFQGEIVRKKMDRNRHTRKKAPKRNEAVLLPKKAQAIYESYRPWATEGNIGLSASTPLKGRSKKSHQRKDVGKITTIDRQTAGFMKRHELQEQDVQKKNCTDKNKSLLKERVDLKEEPIKTAKLVQVSQLALTIIMQPIIQQMEQPINIVESGKAVSNTHIPPSPKTRTAGTFKRGESNKATAHKRVRKSQFPKSDSKQTQNTLKEKEIGRKFKGNIRTTRNSDKHIQHTTGNKKEKNKRENEDEQCTGKLRIKQEGNVDKEVEEVNQNYTNDYQFTLQRKESREKLVENNKEDAEKENQDNRYEGKHNQDVVAKNDKNLKRLKRKTKFRNIPKTSGPKTQSTDGLRKVKPVSKTTAEESSKVQRKFDLLIDDVGEKMPVLPASISLDDGDPSSNMSEISPKLDVCNTDDSVSVGEDKETGNVVEVMKTFQDTGSVLERDSNVEDKRDKELLDELDEMKKDLESNTTEVNLQCSNLEHDIEDQSSNQEDNCSKNFIVADKDAAYLTHGQLLETDKKDDSSDNVDEIGSHDQRNGKQKESNTEENLIKSTDANNVILNGIVKDSTANDKNDDDWLESRLNYKICIPFQYEPNMTQKSITDDLNLLTETDSKNILPVL